jgi:hypothetical protein
MGTIFCTPGARNAMSNFQENPPASPGMLFPKNPGQGHFRRPVDEFIISGHRCCNGHQGRVGREYD